MSARSNKLVVSALTNIFNPNVIHLLQALAEEPEKEQYLKELTEKSNLPPATAHRILGKMVHSKILKESKVGRTRLYRFSDSAQGTSIAQFFKEEIDPLELFLEQIAKIKGVLRIDLQGEATNSRANLIILGNMSNSNEAEMLKKTIAELREKHKFTITYLVVTPEQYTQMSHLGYMGETKTIWEPKPKDIKSN